MKILIIDKNRHVREFLQRELEKDNHTVLLAENGKRVRELVNGSNPFDFIIIDPDLADMDYTRLFQIVSERAPESIVILHTYQQVNGLDHGNMLRIETIEKQGNSIDTIKQFICRAMSNRPVA